MALWDAEEDGLLGAEAYVADPVVPLEDTVAYLNWDIQGANLSPALAGVTVMVGTETGGPNLQAAAVEKQRLAREEQQRLQVEAADKQRAAQEEAKKKLEEAGAVIEVK